jgi:nitroimidazol reductase NimA-like FMN-containing flavoprotein (pyridoxamine 5'-phosphate oxidase superfamily)
MTDRPSRPSDEEIPRPTLVPLDEDTCIELLEDAAVGRLGFITEQGAPSILPINHLVDAGEIVFRTAPGSKLSVALRESGAHVVYEVDEYDASDRSGWSVLVRGGLEPILDRIRIAHLDRTGHHTWVDDLKRTNWVRIVPESVTGRRIVHPDES